MKSAARLILLLLFAVTGARFLMPHYRATLGWKPIGPELLILGMICDQLRQHAKQDGLRRGLTVVVWVMLAASVATLYFL